MRLARASTLTVLSLCGLALAAPPAGAIDSFFDVFTELPITGPPYPTSSLSVHVGTTLGGTFDPTQDHQTSVNAVRLNGLPPGEPVIGTLSVVPGGGGTGGAPAGVSSFFDVFIDYDFPTTPHTAWNRRISDVRIVHPPGTPPGTWRLVPINPAAPPGTAASFFDIFVEDSFFDITYRVADATGTHTYHTHGTSPSGRMSFFDVFVELQAPQVHPDGTVDSFFDVFVDAWTTGPRQSLPDCRETTTGTYNGGTTAVEMKQWSAIKGFYR